MGAYSLVKVFFSSNLDRVEWNFFDAVTEACAYFRIIFKHWWLNLELNSTVCLQSEFRDRYESLTGMQKSSQNIHSSNGKIYVFTDEWTGEIGTGAGFFCSNPYVENSFKLNDYNSIFESEIVGVTQGARWACSNQQVHKPSSEQPSSY